jgi:trehalose synthase-fused probable maltokinase
MASPELHSAPESAQVAALKIDSWSHPFSRKVLGAVAALLPDFLPSQRWFRAKARAIHETDVEDVIGVGNAWILVIRAAYTDGGNDRYLLPVTFSRANKDPNGYREVLANVAGPEGERAVLHSALWDPDFRGEIMRAIGAAAVLRGSGTELVARRTQAANKALANVHLESSVAGAEQSNSSIVYGDRYIFKLFRKLEPGVNPDAEIGVFLTEHGFHHTPAVLGTLEYRARGQTYTAGVLQEFVKNRGDAWKFTLDSLSGFFERATGGRPDAYAPQAASLHPLDLIHGDPPAQIRELLGEFAGKVRLLGQRTAEMHATLCDAAAGRDFAPEPFTREAAEAAYTQMLAEAGNAFELLRRKESTLEERAAAVARALLRAEKRVADCFVRFRDYPVSAIRIRHHGDFHLGQVLYTGSDFVIIDFEGEPQRSLAARRAKALALRDVAGMIRSFQYAAYAALFTEYPDAGASGDLFSALESWALSWSAWAAALYSAAYFSAARDQPFAATSDEERRVLLDAFLLEKSLYEVAYELNNRPAWVRIPLRGALALVA